MISLKLWGKGEREITADIGAALFREFSLENQAIANLRFVDKQGKYAGRSVRHICIFDPKALPHSEKSSFTYDEVVSHQDGVVAIGYIDKDGYIFLGRRKAA